MADVLKEAIRLVIETEGREGIDQLRKALAGVGDVSAETVADTPRDLGAPALHPPGFGSAALTWRARAPARLASGPRSLAHTPGLCPLIPGSLAHPASAP